MLRCLSQVAGRQLPMLRTGAKAQSADSRQGIATLIGLKGLLPYLQELQNGGAQQRAFAKAAAAAKRRPIGNVPAQAPTSPTQAPGSPPPLSVSQRVQPSQAGGSAGLKRSEAKKKGAMQHPAALATPRTLRVTPISPNLLAEPYRPPVYTIDQWGPMMEDAFWGHPFSLPPGSKHQLADLVDLHWTIEVSGLLDPGVSRFLQLLISIDFWGQPPPLPWTAYMRLSGWKERWKRILGGAKSVYTIAKCKRNLRNFELPKFKKEALQLYIDINSMIAQGNRTGLRHVITPGEMTNVKRQLRAREDAGWKRIDWSLAAEPSLGQLEVLYGRLLALDPKNEQMTYAQLTVRIRAKHQFAAYNAKNQLVAGDPNAEIPVQDLWIFEHSFHKAAHSRWRLAGRLSGVPPSPAGSMSWRERLAKLMYGERGPFVAAST